MDMDFGILCLSRIKFFLFGCLRTVSVFIGMLRNLGKNLDLAGCAQFFKVGYGYWYYVFDGGCTPGGWPHIYVLYGNIDGFVIGAVGHFRSHF